VSAVLVTGGTGFLGREIVRQLADRGEEVHVLARHGSPRGPLGQLPIVWHEADLRDSAAVTRALESVAVSARARGGRSRIVHAAALISYRTGDLDLARATNVEGTQNLIAAARKTGVGRFVHVSSVVTVGSSRDGQPVDEGAPFDLGRLGVDYVDTKRAAEEAVIAASREIDAVVVNPGAIFGPIERESNTVRTIRRVAAGKSPPILPPGSVGVVGVRDAADGTLLALDRGRRGERYILVESNLTTRELLATIARALGVPPRGRVLPRTAWSALTAFAYVWDRIAPIRSTPPQALTMLGIDLRFDASKARRELGWSPRPFTEVILETVEHLRARGDIAETRR
jgi:dihydroflavonol-4-reductase